MSAPKLEGKLNAKSLGDILKRLEQNRGAAYLLVSDGLAEKCLYCSVGAIRLTSNGARRALRLEDAVGADPRITPDMMAAAFEYREERGISFEEAIGTLSDVNEVLRESSTRIVRDEILDLILWDGALYEYAEANPPPKIFDPRLEAVKVSLGAAKLLKEALEAVPRPQRLLQKVSGKSIVTAGPAADAAGRDGRQALVLRCVPDEGATFDEVLLAARRAGMDPIEFAEVFDRLLESRALTVPKKEKDKGPALSKEEEKAIAKREVDEIEGALEMLINELAARQRLAKGYMVLGEQQKAVLNLKRVGDELLQRNRAEEAIDAFKQIVQVQPHDFAVREKIAFLYEKLKRVGDAVNEGLDLARLYKQFGLFNRAKQALRRIVGLDPEKVEHRKELIELLVKLKEKDEAIEEFQNLAQLFAQRQQEEEVQAVYRHILALDPQHSQARSAAQALVRRAPGFWIPYAGVAAGFIVLAIAYLWVSSEYRSYAGFKEAQRVAYERFDRKEYALALAALDEYERRFPGSRALERSQGMKAHLERLETTRKERQAQREYEEARKLELAGDVGRARSLYASLVSSAQGTSWAERAQERQRDIAKRNDEGERVFTAMRRAEQERNWREAFERARELARNLPWTDAAQRAEAKIDITSTPTGAKVMLENRRAEGETPTRISQKILAPFTLTLTLPGFLPETRTIDLRQDTPFPIEFELRRALRWQRTLLGPVAAAPLVEEAGIFVGGLDQRLYALETDGRVRWQVPLGLFADVESSPIRSGSRIVVADRSGGVTAVNSLNGAIEWRERLRGAASTVMGVGAEAVIVFETLEDEGSLVALDTGTGRERWRVRVPGGPAAAPTASPRDGTVVVPSGDAFLLVLDARTGAERARVRTSARPTAPAALTEQGYLVATEGDMVRAIGRDGKIAWQVKAPAQVRARPLVADGAAFLGAGNTLVALEMASGQERFPKQEYRAAIRAAPAFADGHVYVATTAGSLVSVASKSGSLRWTYRTGGEITASPIAGADTVYLGSADFGLYAIKD